MPKFVSWKASGAIWTGIVKLQYKGHMLVKVAGCSDPQAYVPINQEVWVTENDLVPNPSLSFV